MLRQKTSTPFLLHPLTKSLSLPPNQYINHSIKKTPPIIKYLTKITSTRGETSSELCRRLVSSINLSKQTLKSYPKHVRESTDAVVWKADSADSLKDAKLFLSSLPNIHLHDPILLNPTITVLGLPTWVWIKNWRSLSISFFHLLIPALSVPLDRDLTHEILLPVISLSKFQALFFPQVQEYTSPFWQISFPLPHSPY